MLSQGKMKKLLTSLSPQQYELLVGRQSHSPLTQAFSRKRVVHPSVKGKPFSRQESGAVWQSVMQQKATQDEVRTAYIHIPFCSHMCLYCGFFQNYANEEKETVYVNHLIQELARDHKSPYVQSAPVRAVFLGGGTPSALSPNNIRRLLRAVRQYLSLANDYELTLEGRVHDLTEEKLDAWFAEGVNRLSIGVQSFHTEIRQMVGRLDAREIVRERLAKAAAYNQAALIIDLIFGLPGQTTEHVLQDLADMDTLPIDGMDLYQLNLFDNSPLKRAIDAGQLPLAARTAQQAEMFAAAGDWLRSRMYQRRSGCHWSRTGRERNLYNTLTKSGAKVLPFGAGAGGFVGDTSLFLQRDLNSYEEMVERGEKPLMVLMKQSKNNDLHHAVLSQLELGWFAPYKLAKQFSVSAEELCELAQIWHDNGLLQKEKVLYTLTEAGRFWQANIAQSILESIEVLAGGVWSPEIQQIAEQG